MTLDELLAREGIRKTLATYNNSGDWLRINDFAGVFTEDGVLESPQFRLEGRAQILAWLSGEGVGEDKKSRPAVKFMRHNLTTCDITLEGADRARSRTYFFVVTDIGPDHAGVYSDELHKVGDRWLIKHRKIRMDWYATNSVVR
jgi:hypothetical protein